jgi:F0F1-type ATP synthase membrane subunit b/b'
LLGNAREKAERESEKRNAKLDETFLRQAKESEHRIDVIRREVSEKMAPIAIDTAADIVKKLIGISVDKKKIEKMILGAKL